MEIAAGEYGYRPDVLPPDARGRCRRRAPDRRDALRRHHRIPPRRGRWPRRSACRSRRTAPRRSTPRSAARGPTSATSSTSTTTTAIEHMLFDGAPTPERRHAPARPVAAGAGHRLQASRRRRATRVDGRRGIDHDDDRRSRPRHAPGPCRGRSTSTRAGSRPSCAATIQGEVRFDAGSRALYATDGSNYRQVPIGVVIPESIDDVIATVAVCREHGAPILSRGGGTSLTGRLLQRRRRDGLLQVAAPRPLDRPRPASSRGSSRARRSTTSATRPRSTASPSRPTPRRTSTARSAG